MQVNGYKLIEVTVPYHFLCRKRTRSAGFERLIFLAEDGQSTISEAREYRIGVDSERRYFSGMPDSHPASTIAQLLPTCLRRACAHSMGLVGTVKGYFLPQARLHALINELHTVAGVDQANDLHVTFSR